MRMRTMLIVLVAVLAPVSLVGQGRGSRVDAGERERVGIGLHVTGWAPGFTLSARLGDVVDLGVDLSLLLVDDEQETTSGGENTSSLQSLVVGPFLRLFLGTREAVVPTLELHGGYVRNETTAESGGVEVETVEDGFALGTTLGLTWFASSRFEARGGVLVRYRSTTATSGSQGFGERDRTRWDLFRPAFSVTFRF